MTDGKSDIIHLTSFIRHLFVGVIAGADEGSGLHMGEAEFQSDAFPLREFLGRDIAFDREMLLALPQGTVKAKPIESEKEATFKGPVLREVLHLIEAAMVKTTFVASDGYSGYLLPQDIKASDYILALEVDGKPLGLGQQGPLWLMNTRKEGETVGKDNRGSHVWALVYMHIGE